MGDLAAQPIAVSHANAARTAATSDWCATGSPELDLPSWVMAARASGGALASAMIPAKLLRGDALAEAAFAAFSGALAALPAAPCRVWSFLPDPTDADVGGLDRYMRTNVGRTRAYRQCPHALAATPAGTCTGHYGDQLVVHALSLPGPVQAVENPRQRPAWSYTERFGPAPPPFARGALVGNLLIASGTASVVGEASQHEGDLDAQWAETLANLQALAACTGARSGWRSMQIYVRDAQHVDRVVRLARAAFAVAPERVLHAPLCRRELLVEIEAVADVA